MSKGWNKNWLVLVKGKCVDFNGGFDLVRGSHPPKTMEIRKRAQRKGLKLYSCRCIGIVKWLLVFILGSKTKIKNISRLFLQLANQLLVTSKLTVLVVFLFVLDLGDMLSHPHVMLHCYDLGLVCTFGLIILPSPFKPPCPQGEGLLF